MSLKAKLEAVIYAAEEPVTLAQLTALFATEALEWRAERTAAAGADAAAQSESTGTLPLLDEGFAYLGLEQTPAFYTAEPVPADGTPLRGPTVTEQPAPPDKTANPDGIASDEAASDAPGALVGAERESAPVTRAENHPGSKMGEGEPDAGSEADPKREARSRDREVRAILKELIDELISSYAADDRGIEIREIAGGYRVATKPECHDAVRQFVRSLKPPLKLSLPALETLAIVAYKQPVTAPEVSEIRGVESAGTLGSLLSRKLIATAGRKQVIGRPILYKTTREFLLRFGLKDVSELPSMEEFEKMAAIELDEQAQAEENPNGAELSEEANEEVGLTDSFERTGGETGGESAPSGESPMSAPSEAAPTASGTSEPAETEAFPHET
ncbi:MAG: SMC-Scp complex subunit ScpB [Terracidiphilus sp.]